MIIKKMRHASLNLTVIACVVVGSTAQAGNLIQNGSFESPVEPGTGIWTGQPPPTDWTGGTGIIFQGSVGGGWPAPEDGIQYADIGFTGFPALSQVVDIPSTGKYSLTWYDDEFIGDGHIYSVLINGTPVATVAGTGSATWTADSVTLTLSAGDNTLSFQGGGPGADTLIDNVALNAVSSVPDTASTFIMLNMAVFGVAALRRRLS